MASPNAAITELVATTIRNRQKEFADNVTNHNALLMRLESKGNIRMTDGGRSILEEIEWDENSTASFYAGYEVLDTTPQDVLSGAEFDWKQASTTVTANGLETRTINKGEAATAALLGSRITNAMHSMKNLMAERVYSDGTADAGKEIGGLQLLIADDPTTSTVIGGINQNTFTFWRNKAVSNAAITTTNITSLMNTLWIQLLRGADKPDLIMADQNLYTTYEAALQQQQRFMSPETGAAGFESLKYKTADVVYDDQCPANHMYFINTDYLYLRVDPDTNYEPVEERASVNQDAIVIPILWTGNMTTCIRRLQGVLFQT